MYKKFASIANSAKYGYAYDSDSWEYNKNPFLSQRFRMFETCGDGLTQHSHDWPVTEEYAIDYLFSLAAVLVEDAELADSLVSMFHVTVRPDTLKFAASLIYDPEKDSLWEKRRFYSMSQLKVTRNREKEHDDRYKELREYQNGTPESIFALCRAEYSDGLEAWQIANAVRDWASENLKNGYMEMPAVQLKWFERVRQGEQYAQARLFRDAFDTCQNAADSHRNRKNAASAVENYRDQLEREAKREAEKAAAEEATTETAA